MELSCPYQLVCSGCQLRHLPYNQQIREKQFILENLLKKNEIEISENRRIQFLSAGEEALRTRLDFTIHNEKFGLLDKAHENIVDLEHCPQLDPTLNILLKKFREIKWPIQKGSVRLRIGPDGQFGAWLDFANIDIMNLLKEKKSLERLLEFAKVEIGQRRKILTKVSSSILKLKDPELNCWFKTWHIGQENKLEEFKLNCHVASFTQPGFKSNRLLVLNIIKAIQEIKPQHILEYGAGIGNFTIPLLDFASKITIVESDKLSLLALNENVERFRMTRVGHKFNLCLSGNLNEFANIDTLFVNPPRSGLGIFLRETLAANFKKPDSSIKNIIYLSCHPQSAIADIKQFTNYGFLIKDIKIIDQFPQTKHFEILTILKIGRSENR